MKKPLPPLNSIRAFESAARHMNFSRAAEELGVTQGAISKQVLTLEDYIGTRLFEREPGGLVLTEEGRSVRVAVSPVFDALDEIFSRYSRRLPRSNRFRLSTIDSFAAYFLVPHLDRIKQQIPQIELELLTSPRLVNFDREEVDLSVRYGPGSWSDVISTPLVPGQLTLVTSPQLINGPINDVDIEALILSTRRIQVYSNNEWRKWSKLTGITAIHDVEPFVIEKFVVAIKALVAGQGVALLPELLVRDEVASGRLIRLSDSLMDWDQTFYIVHPPNADAQPIVGEVINWLLAAAAEHSAAAE